MGPIKAGALVQGCCGCLEQGRGLGLRSGICLRTPASLFTPRHMRILKWAVTDFATQPFSHGVFEQSPPNGKSTVGCCDGNSGNTIYGCVLVYLWSSTQGTAGKQPQLKTLFCLSGQNFPILTHSLSAPGSFYPCLCLL